MSNRSIRSSAYLFLVLSLLALLLPAPAYAYADPSGGALFQILMPLFAMLWGAWMIFANRVRKAFARIFRGLRGKRRGNTTVDI
jgi:hypothetical protein